MALQATPYKVDLNLTDLDRSVYENLRFTVAKHPSETEERLAVRLIAYALWYHEQLAFGRGLSAVDEPALWADLLRAGVDGLITNQPGRLAGFVEAGPLRRVQDVPEDEREHLTRLALRPTDAARPATRHPLTLR